MTHGKNANKDGIRGKCSIVSGMENQQKPHK
jgi:hypothetical protein